MSALPESTQAPTAEHASGVVRSLPHDVIRLWSQLGVHRQRQFILLVGLMLIGSIAELLSVGIIFPFLVALTAPDKILSSDVLASWLGAAGISTVNGLLLALTLAVVVAALASNAVRLLLSYASIRFGYAVGTDLNVRIFRDALCLPYAQHVRRNSSELISGITVKANTVIHGVLMPLLVMVNAAFVLTVVAALVFVARPMAALSVLVLSAITYASISRFARRRLSINSERISHESAEWIKTLQEGLGGIRDVLLEGSQELHAARLHAADEAMRRAQAENAALGSVPRYVMEFVGIAALALLAYALAVTQEDFSAAVPALGMLAMGAQRMLPYLQQALSSWLSMRGSAVALRETLELLEQPVASPQARVTPMVFERQIELRNAGFRYSADAPTVLHDVNIVIAKGSRLGIVGATGSGKSTLLDMLMGLLEPTEGSLLVDGEPVTAANARAWQSRIAHVPQAIFLADTTIEENIALGIQPSQIDRALLTEVARQAQIHDAIVAMPKGYQTRMGERGVRLSGGQRQRIGIARALYKRADVILLDEATSALDSRTEDAVMAAVEMLGSHLTILIVTHRLETLRNCERVIRIDGGTLAQEGRSAGMTPASTGNT